MTIQLPDPPGVVLLISSSDLPHYYTTWSALIVTLLTLLLPEPLVQPSAVFLSDSFGVDQQTKTFMTRQVLQVEGGQLGVMTDISPQVLHPTYQGGLSTEKSSCRK